QGRVSRHSDAFHGNPLPLARGRTGVAAELPGDHGGDRGRPDHGPRPSRTHRARRAVPSREHRLGAWTQPAREFPAGGRAQRAGLDGGRMTTDATDFKSLISIVANGQALTAEQAEAAFDTMMSGDATPSQMGAFLMALRVRGETIPEITG